MNILTENLIGNPVERWLLAIGILLLTAVLLRLLVRLIAQRLQQLAARTETHWDDVLASVLVRTRSLFFLVLGIYVASRTLTLPAPLPEVFDKALLVALLVQAGIWANAFMSTLLKHYRQRASEANPSATTTISAVELVARIVIWALVLLLALDNFGINVTALITGLGIGGVAVALAVQNILGDLFASLSIMLDKPFVEGDFLMVDDLLGRVERIGLKTTRVRSLSGEQLIFSNSDLLNSRVRNYGRMFERRVVFTLGVTYDTPREKLEKIPRLIREAVESQETTRFDRAHFMRYGDYALLFESVYFVLSPDYNLYMDRQQSINFRIHEAFEQLGVAFAFPTQTLHVPGLVSTSR